jgi:hypothetical protein
MLVVREIAPGTSCVPSRFDNLVNIPLRCVYDKAALTFVLKSGTELVTNSNRLFEVAGLRQQVLCFSAHTLQELLLMS